MLRPAATDSNTRAIGGPVNTLIHNSVAQNTINFSPIVELNKKVS
jgi:hypothetical protein